jgi:hypothetical protein
VRVLKTVTFAYDVAEDRIAAVLNVGMPEAWACWLTRRITLPVLRQVQGLLDRTSALAQQVGAEFRTEIAAFEREAATANLSNALRPTPLDSLKTITAQAKCLQRLMITPQGGAFRIAFQTTANDGASGLIDRADLHRIMQVLRREAHRANWIDAAAPAPETAPAPPKPVPPLVRH